MSAMNHPPLMATETDLVRLALDLGADGFGGPLSRAERALIGQAGQRPACDPSLVAAARSQIRAGDDPLGDLFCALRSPLERRSAGAFYTPEAIVAPMTRWALASHPTRLVDPGCGSGRFSAAAVRADLALEIVAIDRDPLATLLTRATLAALDARATVLNADYLTVRLPAHDGRTAFVGNPPYVRHHDLSAATKAWAVSAAQRLGQQVSGLAGLHALFFLATTLHARPGDVGCFITSAEWLDVGYGAIVRRLFTDGLGGQGLDLVDPRAVPFEDAMTTALIACFEVGATPTAVRVHLVAEPTDLAHLAEGRSVPAVELRRSGRWSYLFRQPARSAVDGVPADRGSARGRTLGDLVRVHRGFVSGGNDFFILTRERAADLGIAAWCRPAITSAVEIIRAGGVIRDAPERRVVLDLPANFDRAAHPAVDAYLADGERRGVPAGYIASHRRPWWRVGAGEPAPIVASYMARQAPRFALNPDGLALLNIGHGLHPKEPMTDAELRWLVETLNGARDSYRGNGRTYHGGLEKFEPREMEALPIPSALAPVMADFAPATVIPVAPSEPSLRDEPDLRHGPSLSGSPGRPEEPAQAQEPRSRNPDALVQVTVG